MIHQQRVSCSGLYVIECAVGEWRQNPPLAFLLEEDILSTCCDKNDVCSTYDAIPVELRYPLLRQCIMDPQV